MSHTGDCFICQKHRGEIVNQGGAVYSDDLVYVGHAAISPDGTLPLLGHFLVEPKRHVASPGDLNDEEARRIGLLLAHTSRAVKAITEAEHIYLFVLGNHVDHFHLHVVPRHPGTPREYWGLRVDEWPDAPRGSEQEIILLCDKMRAWLAEEGS